MYEQATEACNSKPAEAGYSCEHSKKPVQSARRLQERLGQGESE